MPFDDLTTPLKPKIYSRKHMTILEMKKRTAIEVGL